MSRVTRLVECFLSGGCLVFAYSWRCRLSSSCLPTSLVTAEASRASVRIPVTVTSVLKGLMVSRIPRLIPYHIGSLVIMRVIDLSSMSLSCRSLAKLFVMPPSFPAWLTCLAVFCVVAWHLCRSTSGCFSCNTPPPHWVTVRLCLTSTSVIGSVMSLLSTVVSTHSLLNFCDIFGRQKKKTFLDTCLFLSLSWLRFRVQFGRLSCSSCFLVR